MESLLLNRLSVLSHPNRMAVFRLLIRRCPQALPAGEIARVLNLKPSTASVYLSALTTAGLISQERHGTSLLYHVNLTAAREVVADLFLDCCGGRPDLCPPGPEPSPGPAPRDPRPLNVLFICTGNSARSIFAEAILRQTAGERFNAFSGGTHPKAQINPLALEILHAQSVETASLRTKPVQTFQAPSAPRMDFVFTVCDDAANQDSSPWHGQPLAAHWGIPGPTTTTGGESAFRETFDALARALKDFTALPLITMDRAALQHSLDDIGRTIRPS